MLESHQSGNDSGRENNVWNEVVGELRRDRINWQTIGVPSGTHKQLRQLPDGVVTSHEDDPALLQGCDAEVVCERRCLVRLQIVPVG